MQIIFMVWVKYALGLKVNLLGGIKLKVGCISHPRLLLIVRESKICI